MANVGLVPVAQWIAHQTSDLGVGGSSPPRDSLFCSAILVSCGTTCSGNRVKIIPWRVVSEKESDTDEI